MLAGARLAELQSSDIILPPDEHRKVIRELYKPRLPMDKLPSKYVPTTTNPYPILLHFGIPTSGEALTAYALKKSIAVFEKDDPTRTCTLRTPVAAVKRLVKECGFRDFELMLQTPRLLPRDCDYLVALYSNHTMRKHALILSEENEVLDIIRRELDLDKNIPAMWYFHHGDEWMPGDPVD
ncbi:hypothetical protein OF83DRAFT_792820 [Amylostereum chailletii]|nr:hypothetical protein OF83DRAFT_792820 [Amylostereum chailletii]